jgi:membrane associated rhomboid family serine protease
MRQLFEKQSEPAIRAPAIVLGLIFALIVVHLIRLADPAFDETVLEYLAFYQGSYWWSWVTYAFVHGDWAHLAINSFWMLAFGSVVAQRMGAVRFVIFSAICAAAGVIPYWFSGEQVLLVGASAAISGQMAGAVRLIYAGGALPGGMQQDMEHVRALSLAELLRNRQALMFLALWAGLNLFFGTGSFTADGGGEIAWEAHFGGFIGGLLLFGFFDKPRD